MTNANGCSFCDVDEEDFDHVLQKCPLAKTIQTNLLSSDLHRAFFEKLISKWIKNVILKDEWPQTWRIGCCVMCWKLWSVRNQQIFTDLSHSVDEILCQIRSIVSHTKNILLPFVLICT